MSTETTQEHQHSFPCNPPGGTYLNPGPCSCGKTHAQGYADRLFATAAGALKRACGDSVRVSVHWGVTSGPEDDGRGSLEYDDEDSAREHARWTGGIVAKRTVVSLPWETVPGEKQQREGGDR